MHLKMALGGGAGAAWLVATYSVVMLNRTHYYSFSFAFPMVGSSEEYITEREKEREREMEREQTWYIRTQIDAKEV